MDTDLQALVTELRDGHGCHTVLLYGSHARGDATPQSDYDVLGIRAEGPALRDARPWRGTWLDAFVVPEADLATPGEAHLHLLGARVLLEREDCGRRLLAAVAAVEAAGPKALPEDEAAARRAWLLKMAERAARGDLEGQYRRAWLQFQALEDYFALRRLWFRGGKEALAWLAVHDPAAHAAFAAALAPGAGAEAQRELARRVAA